MNQNKTKALKALSNNTTVGTSVLQRIGDSCGFVNSGWWWGASSVGGDGYGANEDSSVCLFLDLLSHRVHRNPNSVCFLPHFLQ